jgi:hypothetical protein
VTFLPGAMLTLGMTELAYGEMVAGASRLMTGFVQLFLLAFGLAAGAGLVGVGPDTLVESTEFVQLPWAAWAGVVVFGLGVYLLIGLFLLARPVAAALAVPFVFGVLLLIEGIGLIIWSFKVRAQPATA